jgi:peroxiredoxin
MSRLQVGDRAPPLEATSIAGRRVVIPDHDSRLTHVQFRRFAGCPVCNMHLRTLARRRAELAAQGLRQVVFIHSSDDEMRQYQAQLPFDCVADAEMRHYRAWGVERSARALLHPRVLVSGARWVITARRFYRKAENGILGLPADFLIDARGTVIAVKYGMHADDQWDADELLNMTSGAPGG